MSSIHNDCCLPEQIEKITVGLVLDLRMSYIVAVIKSRPAKSMSQSFTLVCRRQQLSLNFQFIAELFFALELHHTKPKQAPFNLVTDRVLMGIIHCISHPGRACFRSTPCLVLGFLGSANWMALFSVGQNSNKGGEKTLYFLSFCVNSS